MTFEEQLNKLDSQYQMNLTHSSKINEEKKTCKICNGNLFVLNANGDAVPCVCRQKEIQRRVLKFASIPDKYSDATFDNYRTDIYQERDKMDKIKSMLQAYVAEFKLCAKGIYIASETKGSGKTRMIATIGNALLDKGHMVKFATSNSILEEIKKSWDRNSEYTESQLVNDLIRADILIIDDFGMEKSTDWVNDKFYYIINSRYEKKRTTMYTSNYRINEIDYNDRITNRIKETCYILPWPEESMREKQAVDNMRELKGMISK